MTGKIGLAFGLGTLLLGCAPRPGESFRDCATCPEMVMVRGGTFLMGPQEEEIGEDAPDWQRPHEVAIADGLAVGVYEVTFDEWEACVEEGGCRGYLPQDKQGWGRGRRPVINVNWDDAQNYASWLRAKTGQKYRLLSESEWEYVARAGSRTPYHVGEEISEQDANCGKSVGMTVEVGSYPANAFALHDVHGNVWEWVQDCWHDSYRGSPRDGSAWESGTCLAKVLRGASWNDDCREELNLAARAEFYVEYRVNNVGFRVARDPVR